MAHEWTSAAEFRENRRSQVNVLIKRRNRRVESGKEADRTFRFRLLTARLPSRSRKNRSYSHVD